VGEGPQDVVISRILTTNIACQMPGYFSGANLLELKKLESHKEVKIRVVQVPGRCEYVNIEQ